MIINWVQTIYGPPDGRGWHVHSLVKWKGRYYIAFAGGSGHDSDDSEARLCVSSDLENWDSRVAISQKRCFTMNYDFWHPIEHGGRSWVACDSSGHSPEGHYTDDRTTAGLTARTDG